MTYQSRMYLVWVLLAGFIAPALRAEDKTPVSYFLVGCVVVGVAAYKVHEYFNPTHVRLAQLEEGLAAFKKETAQNFVKVVDGQALLADGQGKLTEGQQQLQQQVAAVDQQVAATRKEVEDVHAKTTQILEDTTSLKVSVNELQQKIADINAKLERQIKTIAKLEVENMQAHKKTQGQLDRIESSMIKKSDMPGISKDLELMIQKAVQKEFERVCVERSDYRALPDASLSSGSGARALPALQVLKQIS